MAEALSPADRSALNSERGPITMSVGGLLILEEGPGLTPAALAQRLRERIHLIPRYRQKLKSLTGGLVQPTWVDDDAFDPEWHVRPATLPAPGDDAQLAEHVGRVMSQRIDRSRPLWELHVISGLEGGRTALMPKMHHALVDGIAAIDVGTVLLDPGEESLVIEPEDWSPEASGTRSHLTRLAGMQLVRAQKLVKDSTLRALDTSPRRAAEDLWRGTELLTELARQRPQAPMTPLNRPISASRRFARASGSLTEIKRVAKSFDATVNDVLLAVVAGTLERYLAGVAADMDRRSSPVALVPVSVRREDQRGETGNRISMVFVDLPVREIDPVARIRVLHAQMTEIKASAAVRAGAIMVGAIGLAPPVVSAALGRALGNVRACNLVVSNVPGPQQTFYLAGSKVLEAYPIVPLNPANQGLTVGILSYDGRVNFGLLADAQLDPPVEHARASLVDALAEIQSLAAAS
jgi:diacylglycerol O-acyltransferase